MQSLLIISGLIYILVDDLLKYLIFFPKQIIMIPRNQSPWNVSKMDIYLAQDHCSDNTKASKKDSS